MNTYTSYPCPRCGNTLTKAAGSKPSATGGIRRKRTCPKCETGFVTYEVTAEEFALLQAIRKFAKDEAHG